MKNSEALRIFRTPFPKNTSGCLLLTSYRSRKYYCQFQTNKPTRYEQTIDKGNNGTVKIKKILFLVE